MFSEGRNPYNVLIIFWEKRWLHKFILKLTDLYLDLNGNKRSHFKTLHNENCFWPNAFIWGAKEKAFRKFVHKVPEAPCKCRMLGSPWYFVRVEIPFEKKINIYFGLQKCLEGWIRKGICHCHLKFIYSEKATKIWKSLALCFDLT